MDALGINYIDKIPKVIFLWEPQGQRLEGTVRQIGAQGFAEGFRKLLIQDTDRGVIEPPKHFFSGKCLTRIPAAKGIVIMAGKYRQILVTEFSLDHDGSRKAPQQRRDRLALETGEDKFLNRICQHQRVFVLFAPITFGLGIESISLCVEKRHDDRYLQGRLAFSGGVGIILGDPQAIAVLVRIETS